MSAGQGRIGLAGQVFLWLYGIILWMLAIMFAGAGHGTYTFLGLVSSPFTVFGTLAMSFGLFAAPLQWGALVTLFSRRVIGRRVLIGYLLLHYVVAEVVLTYKEGPYADWEYARHLNMVFFVSGFVFYGIGQVYLWWVILKNRDRVEQKSKAASALSSSKESFPDFTNVPKPLLVSSLRAFGAPFEITAKWKWLIPASLVIANMTKHSPAWRKPGEQPTTHTGATCSSPPSSH